MNTFHNNQPPISGNLNFKLHPGIDTNVNVNKLSPIGIMVIGLTLAAIGFYLYSNKKEE
jgi:uncharacterized membrane-anchored protein